MDLELTFGNDGPMYRQLYSHIRMLIREGALADGDRLPSVRSLQRHLGISKTTVETAYHLLQEEGYVSGRARARLTVVGPALPPRSSGKRSSSFSLGGSSYRADEPGGRDWGEAPHSRPSRLDGERTGTIDFSLHAVDNESFPLRAWRSAQREAMDLHRAEIHQYGDARGEPALRNSLALYLRQSRGVICSPDRIVIGSGLGSSLRLLSSLLGPGTAVGIEESGVAQVRRAFRQNGLLIEPYELAENGAPTFRESPGNGRQPHVLYATPSHRPSGSPLPYAARLELLRWASRQDGYVLEDDYDGELRLAGRPLPSLHGLDEQGTVIYMGTFSKTLTPALRMNFVVLPPSLSDRLRESEASLSPPSRIDQWTLRLFIERGHWARHLKRMRNVYRAKQEALLECLRDSMPACVRIAGSAAGLHLELEVDAPVSAERLIRAARAEGVLVYGSESEELRAAVGSARIYLGFGGVTLAEIETGTRLLARAWEPPLNACVKNFNLS